MGEDYFLREVEVLCVRFFELIVLLVGVPAARRLVAAAVDLVLQEVYYVDVLFMRVVLAGVDPEKQFPHDIVAHEGVVAVARQIEISAAVVFYNLLLLSILFERRLIQLYPVNLQVVEIFVLHCGLFGE